MDVITIKCKLKLVEFVCSTLPGSLLINSKQKHHKERKTKLFSASALCNVWAHQYTVWHQCARGQWHSWGWLSMWAYTPARRSFHDGKNEFHKSVLNCQWAGAHSVPDSIQLIFNIIFQIWGITISKKLFCIVAISTYDCCLAVEASLFLPRQDSTNREGKFPGPSSKHGEFEC